MAKKPKPGKVDHEAARIAGRYGLKLFALSASEWMIQSRETDKTIATWNPKTGFPTVAGRKLPHCKSFADVVELLKHRFPHSVHDPDKNKPAPPAAKPADPPKDPPFCDATVDEDGNLSIEYRHEPGGTIGRDAHDEDVGDWTDDQIKALIRKMTDLDPAIEIHLDNMAIPSDQRDPD